MRETVRTDIAYGYYKELLGCEFVRADGSNVWQQDIAGILASAYNEKHYGEFGGALERTVCSYPVQRKAMPKLENVLKLHVNSVLYATKGIEDVKNIFARLMEMDLQLVIVGDDDRNTSRTDDLELYDNIHNSSGV